MKEMMLGKVPLAIVGGTFLFAGCGKLWDPNRTEDVLRMVMVPQMIVRAIVHTLPGFEIGIGVAMIIGWWSRPLMAVVGIALVGFTAFLGYLTIANPLSRCACFGPILESWSGGSLTSGMMRNVILLVLLALAWWAYSASRITEKSP